MLLLWLRFTLLGLNCEHHSFGPYGVQMYMVRRNFFFLETLGGSRSCFRFQCVIYMHSLALHDNVAGALGFASSVCKGVELIQVKQTNRLTKILKARQRVHKEK